MSRLLLTLLGENTLPTPAEALAAHVARSHGVVRTYAETLVSLGKAGAPVEILEKHQRHASRMLQRVKSGVSQESNAKMLLDRLHEEVSEYEGDMTFAMGRKTHGPFVTAFKKKFKVDVHHYDEVGTGVYLYLDAENTSKLRDTLSGNAVFDLPERLGYVLLRRGTQDDIDYGSFGEALSQWIFAQVIRPGSGPDDQEGQQYTASQLKKIESMLQEALRDEPEPRQMTDVEIRIGERAFVIDAEISYTMTEGGPTFQPQDITLQNLRHARKAGPVQLPHNSSTLQQIRDIVYEMAVEQSGEWT